MCDTVLWIASPSPSLPTHTHTLDLFPSPSSSCIRSSLYLFVQFPTEVLRYSGPSLLLNAQCEIRFVPCACPVKRYALFAEGKTRSSSCLSVVSAPGTHRGPCVSRLEDAPNARHPLKRDREEEPLSSRKQTELYKAATTCFRFGNGFLGKLSPRLNWKKFITLFFVGLGRGFGLVGHRMINKLITSTPFAALMLL